jgi:phthalate 4,5-dioxygenase oxygenase subunit
MLSAKENETLTRVGAGTPMGELMRRYWIPAAMSWEVEPDGAPLRVQLLGERLVAFRDTSGRTGLMVEYCPHRGASLFFGRNEEDGLRCVYHGWKYDATGQCVDQMNESGDTDFSNKVKNVAYPVTEVGGLVWAYLGPPEKRPALPLFAWTQVANDQRHVNKTFEECNWLQAMEGGLDTSHAPIMHRRLVDDTDLPGVSPSSPFVRGKAPRLEVDFTDYGYAYYGVRELEDNNIHVRGYHFVMPFTQIRQEPFSGKDIVAGHMWVPLDDNHCMVYNWEYSPSGTGMEDQKLVARILGTGPGDQTSDFKKVRSFENDYMIDREAQKKWTFTGIYGVNTQDHAVQEVWGQSSIAQAST